jgi:predicted transcriptional regulator
MDFLACEIGSMNQSVWTFLTNHGHVLLCLSAQPELRMREVASRVGITERAVQKIISDLSEDGYLEIERQGRRNSYTVVRDKRLRHPIEAHKSVEDLISMVSDRPE